MFCTRTIISSTGHDRDSTMCFQTPMPADIRTTQDRQERPVPRTVEPSDVFRCQAADSILPSTLPSPVSRSIKAASLDQQYPSSLLERWFIDWRTASARGSCQTTGAYARRAQARARPALAPPIMTMSYVSSGGMSGMVNAPLNACGSAAVARCLIAAACVECRERVLRAPETLEAGTVGRERMY
jgi:hypothetical protein